MTERPYLDQSTLLSVATVRDFRREYNGRGIAGLVSRLTGADLTVEKANVLLHDIVMDALMSFASRYEEDAPQGEATALVGDYRSYLEAAVRVRLGSVPDKKRRATTAPILTGLTTSLSRGRVRLGVFDVFAEGDQLMFCRMPANDRYRIL
jgi:hypothetical protein